MPTQPIRLSGDAVKLKINGKKYRGVITRIEQFTTPIGAPGEMVAGPVSITVTVELTLRPTDA